MWSVPMDNAVRTIMDYLDEDGKICQVEIAATESTCTINRYKPGSKITHTTYYKPMHNSPDEFSPEAATEHLPEEGFIVLKDYIK